MVVAVAAAAAVVLLAVVAVVAVAARRTCVVCMYPLYVVCSTSPCKHVLIVSGGCENTETNGVNIIAAENRARSGVAPIESL